MRRIVEDLCSSCPATTSYNVTSGLLTIARFLTAFHYEYILSMWGGCPVVVDIGHPETGKSTAVVMGLAMTGLVKNISRRDEIVHEKLLYERMKVERGQKEHIIM